MLASTALKTNEINLEKIHFHTSMRMLEMAIEVRDEEILAFPGLAAIMAVWALQRS